MLVAVAAERAVATNALWNFAEDWVDYKSKSAWEAGNGGVGLASFQWDDAAGHIPSMPSVTRMIPSLLLGADERVVQVDTQSRGDTEHGDEHAVPDDSLLLPGPSDADENSLTTVLAYLQKAIRPPPRRSDSSAAISP